MTKIKIFVETDLVGSRVTETVPLEDLGYTEEEWSELNQSDKECVLDDLAHDYHYDLVHYGAYEVEE